MSTGPDSSIDLVAVACVVESSLLLASEWSRILIEYVYPLLKRLNELHPSHQFRLAFVTYGAADTRPLPLLSKRFFAPLSLVTKELREEPSKLGIGQTNSGSGRGLSALEGLVAAIELFDILMASTNFAANLAQTQSPQKEGRSLISHLLHIAASPPDSAQRPHCNTLQHLDSVNWESIPSELKKRKINLSLISLRKIPQFQDLQSSVAGPGVQSPWFNVRAPHVLLLVGFPTPQKPNIKRQTDVLLSDSSPDAKRQKIAADTSSRASPASPALSPARTPQSQRSQQPVSLQVPQPQPMTTSSQNPSSAQLVPAIASAPAATPATTSAALLQPSAPSMPLISPQVLDQVVTPTGLKFGQMMERLRALEREIVAIDSRITNAQNTGQAAILAGLQKDRAPKVQFKEQIKLLLRQHYQKMLLAKEALNAQVEAAGSVPSNGSAEPGPSTQSHPPTVPSESSDRTTAPAVEDHKPAISDSQVLAQFWQSRGGTISALNGSAAQAGPSQIQSHPTVSPELAAQMQKLIDKKGIRPPNLGLLQGSGTTPHEMTSNATNNQVIQAPNVHAWQGTISATFSGQAANALQIHAIGIFAQPPSSDLRTDTWPKNLALKACKEPLKDSQELLSWLKRHQSRTHAMQFRPNPRAPDGSINEQKFHALHKFMSDSHIYAYAGWQMPSGKFAYQIIIFPLQTYFAGAMFPDGLPDLPGSGNMLDSQPAEEAKLFNGLNLFPAFKARMQTLEPAKQKQVFAYFVQEQLRRQQMQQAQQPHTASSQIPMPTPPNPYRAVANIPSLHTNVNIPANIGASNTAGGTVNYEMLQSFMQRSAEGSTSQGMNPS